MTIPPESNEQIVGMFWMLRINGQLPSAVEPGLTATFSLAGPADIADLATAMGLDDSEPVLQRFERGCHCHIVRVEEQLVSYGWITFDREDIGSLGLSVHLLPGEAYIWDCATLATYRGQRLYPALLSYMLRELRASGFQRVWIGMDADNLPSLAGVARAGFQQIVALLQDRQAPARTFVVRGCPGVTQQDVQDARYALLGKRGVDRMTLAE